MEIQSYKQQIQSCFELILKNVRQTLSYCELYWFIEDKYCRIGDKYGVIMQKEACCTGCRRRPFPMQLNQLAEYTHNEDNYWKKKTVIKKSYLVTIGKNAVISGTKTVLLELNKIICGTSTGKLATNIVIIYWRQLW